MSKIVFFHPSKVASGGNSGSSVRPYQMLNAFKELGHEVIEVTGSYQERKKIIKKKIFGYKDIRFMYAESSNTPLTVSNIYRFPLINSVDVKLFKYLNKTNVPIGLFLRDIYWLFQEQHKSKSFLKRIFERYFRDHELNIYDKTIDVLFLPTKIMAEYLPDRFNFESVESLPPGCIDQNVKARKADKHRQYKMELLYIGNIAPPLYDIRELVKMISNKNDIGLNIICREKDWKRNKELYENYLSDNIQVHHKSGNELIPFYSNADVFVTYRKHHPYLDITLPVKIPEAWGNGLPVIVKDGGKDAEWVKDLNGGWVVQNLGELDSLLERLLANKNLINKQNSNIEKIISQNSWLKRAEFIDKVLTRFR